MMTDDQIATLRQRLTDGRQPIIRGEQYAHPRGWNDALEYVERVLRKVLGEPEPKKDTPA